jgi:methionine-S-sulfoxide reductase
MPNTKTIVLGGGCFWCTEALFKSIKGITSVTSGYATSVEAGEAGENKAPTYDQVSSGETNFVESIQMEYDPSRISFRDLLIIFFNTHDPTTLNKQGADVGTQYRSVIFYTTEEEKEEALRFIQELNIANAYGPGKSVVTAVEPLVKFYEAEDYHKNYYENHPEDAYCQIVIAPKLEKLQKRFAELIK